LPSPELPPSNPSAARSPASSSRSRADVAVRDPIPLWPGRARTIARAVMPLALFALAIAHPALAVPVVVARRVADQGSFVAGLTSSFVLVLASEIGDKTFFISALLSMKYSRALVLIGTMLALGSMTVMSVVIGQVFHALPASLNSTIPFDDYAAAALLLWFGFQSIRDGLAMNSGGDDGELRDATEVVEEATGKAVAGPTGARVVTETSSLVFLAEWGDKSMLATVALAAAQSPLGVVVGGISGHFVASIIAVLSGSFLGRYISERRAKLIGGVLFWVFAILTIFNLF
jgi:putative Ca2+/H+ antiporter (TMEM165/GDT1 family)